MFFNEVRKQKVRVSKQTRLIDTKGEVENPSFKRMVHMGSVVLKEPMGYELISVIRYHRAASSVFDALTCGLDL